jgi:hypothetical protein
MLWKRVWHYHLQFILKISVYKFVLFDEFGEPIRKFATRLEAKPYMTEGTKLVKLPKQPSLYQQAITLLGESPF